MKKQKRDHDWAKAKWNEPKDQLWQGQMASDGIPISSYTVRKFNVNPRLKFVSWTNSVVSD
jgi:hypothetical protein